MSILNQIDETIRVNENSVASELRKVTNRHAELITWAACVIYPLWVVLDYLFASEHWLEFLFLRLAETALIASTYWFVKRYQKSYELLLYVIFLGIAFQISFMCAIVSEEALQTYFLGFATIFISANLIIIWRPIHSLFVLLGALFSYAFFFALYSHVSIIEVIKNGGLLFLTISSTSTIVAWLHYTFIKRDIISKLQLAQTNEELTKANKEITHSLKYAKRIQDAVLSKYTKDNSIFIDFFACFQAKDIVSGDFYWISDAEFHEATGKIVIAAVDCTGHGITGGLMSFIGETNLNRIVNIAQTASANDILCKLHDTIRKLLRQDIGQTPDGMDVALCTIDPENREIEFAGAHNPLLYIQNGVIHQIKGDRLSIGGQQLRKNKRFTKHTISLTDTPTSFYLFTDGFLDQVGGEHGHKFMIQRFRELLLQIADKPMYEQKKILQTAFRDWMGDYPQTDDVLVLGFKM